MVFMNRPGQVQNGESWNPEKRSKRPKLDDPKSTLVFLPSTFTIMDHPLFTSKAIYFESNDRLHSIQKSLNRPLWSMTDHFDGRLV